MSSSSAVAPPAADAATSARVAVLADPPGGATETAAAALAARLHLPHATALPDAELLLVCTPQRLELRAARMGPVYVDFTARPALTRRQPLARAIGRQARTVVDATAGFAQDAFLLAGLGLTVTAIERNAVVAALVEDGLRRAAGGARLRIVCAEAATLLPQLDPAPDVVYLDPMFPPKRKKSAAVRKEMHVLRALVGADTDTQALLAAGLRCARQRVVVKRPDDAPPLAPHPAVSYPGKLVRYDVYLPVRR